MDQANSQVVPVSVHVGALVLQKHDLPRVMTTHFSICVVDDAEFIISAKQVKAALLNDLHLQKTVRV